ncbi:MAG: DUF5615 family PIN-like protein [Flavobacteriales bacterium]|nr:DUF5615 family PIN-like protein [Flavobacteriales bacterium]
MRRLIADGHTLVVARTDISGKKDPAVLAEANARDCILLTEDKDFGELVFRLKASHAGVVLIRMHGALGDEQAEMESHAIAEQAERLHGAFTVIKRSRLRIRRD